MCHCLLFFFSSRRRHTISVSAFLLNRSSDLQTGAERMPHDLSHLGFLAGQIGRLITISTTPVIASDSFEMDAVGALRLSPLRRGLAIDSRSEERRVGKECRSRGSAYH